MRKLKAVTLVIVISVAAAAVVGRITARNAARDYGRSFKQALSMVGTSEFGNTANLREFLAFPEMEGRMKRMSDLSFLGGGYSERADELRLGMIYLSEQMRLPESQRFSSPPALQHLPLVSADRTDRGLAEAAKRLFASYESKL